METRGARWYYFSSYANLGLGNNVVAMDYAKKAVEMEPDNQEYRQYYQQLQQGGGFSPYGSQTLRYQSLKYLTHIFHV